FLLNDLQGVHRLSSREENLARLRSSVREIQPGQKFEVKDFDPQDAEGIAALFYAVYGETIPVDSVYDPEHYIQANADRQMHHIVGRTASGDVVGLHAYFRNPPGKHIMELGSWIVLPSYRNTSLALRLVQHSLGNVPDYLGLHVVYTQNVCDHLISQKVTDRFKARSCAIELEAMPSRPDDAPDGAGGRISMIDAFLVRQDIPHAVRLPSVYAAVLEGMYASRGLQREFVEDDRPQGMSRSSVESMDAASLARMTVQAVGTDIAEHIGRFVLESPDRHIHQVVLPLWQPGVSVAVRAARSVGFFLGGLLPLWDDRDMLLMQKLRTEPDYSKVQLYTQEAKELLDLIAADRESLAT
ncbi:MAG TPA: hypothetical protein PLM79_18925, partial [Syntrophobacteraceae bacterium]|nr:hypothetical protein [Syntrophobacteraceae bacterium]